MLSLLFTLLLGTAQSHPAPEIELSQIDAALQQQPNDVELRYRRAELLWKNGSFGEALVSLQKVEFNDQLPYEFILLRGSLLLENGQPANALEDLLMILPDHPDHGLLLHNLARIYEQQQRWLLAHQHYLNAARVQRNPDHYLGAARMAERMDRDDLVRKALLEGWQKLDQATSLEQQLRKRAIPLPSVRQQEEQEAEDIRFAKGRNPLVLDRSPYLQKLSDTAVTIVWRSTTQSSAIVHWGTSLDALDDRKDSNNLSQHEVLISGLNPDTRYYYALELSDGQLIGPSEELHFTTAPVNGTRDRTRIWVVGDSGTGGTMQAQVRDSMLEHVAEDRPDLFLHVGDMAYSTGTDQEFTNRFYAMYADILKQIPIWPAIGNHEGISSSSDQQSGPYYEGYALPTAGESGGLPSGTEAYYSFDYANIHFVVLDSHHSSRDTNGAMLTWLDADLTANQQEWTIAYWHHPPYTKGSHDSDVEYRHIEMRENALPILEAANIDLVLGGHSHVYERSYLLHGAYQTPSTTMGIVDGRDGHLNGDGPYGKELLGAIYVVAGHGGTGVNSSAIHPLNAVTEAKNGSVIIDVRENKLLISNIRYDGAITDRSALIKGDGILLVTPNESQDLQVDEAINIEWHSVGDIPDVDLYWSCDNGENWLIFGEDIPNTGSYPWRAPSIDSDHILFKVQSSSDEAIKDQNVHPLRIVDNQQIILVEYGDIWRYHDLGEDLGEEWLSSEYDDNSWAEGPGKLGYGDGDESTVLNNEDPNDPSVYFRRTVQVNSPVDHASLEVLYDDGVAVWINGELVSSFAFDDTTFASWANSNNENAVLEEEILGEYFVEGENIIAAMVKQHSVSSSDISFDLRLDVIVSFNTEMPGCDSLLESDDEPSSESMDSSEDTEEPEQEADSGTKPKEPSGSCGSSNALGGAALFSLFSARRRRRRSSDNSEHST